MKSNPFLVLLLALLGTMPVAGGEDAVRTIRVKGENSTFVAPDAIVFTLTALSGDDSLAAARERNRYTVQEIIDVARRVGVSEADIQTSEFRIGQSLQKAYRGSKKKYAYSRITVVLRNLVNTDPLLLGLSQLDDVTLDTTKLQSSKEKDLQKRVLANALRDAKTKAEEIAKSVDQRLGEPLSVEEKTVTCGELPEALSLPPQESETTPATAFSLGQLEVHGEVEAVFALEHEATAE